MLFELMQCDKRTVLEMAGQTIPIYIILFSFTLGHVLGHGAMVKPNTWFDTFIYRDEAGKWKRHAFGMNSGEMCHAGFHLDKALICKNGQADCKSLAHPGTACMWYTNFTHIPDTISCTRLPNNMRTFRFYAHDKPAYDWTGRNPWRAPGRAKIHSSCGVAGGNLKGCHTADLEPTLCNGGGYGFGPKAEDFYSTFGHVIKTTWKRGSVVEAAWGITANHGGGYTYRLCKIPASGISGITERCFKKNILPFVGDKQWVQFGKDGRRIEIKADRTRVGTHPRNSVWTKNPIPACKVGHGGFTTWRPEPCIDQGYQTQFKPPGSMSDGLFGFGSSVNGNVKAFKFSIVDKLKVPDNLTPGEYVLSWRWDCEQTPQVWTNCATIRITA